jgi:hypothetical protein
MRMSDLVCASRTLVPPMSLGPFLRRREEEKKRRREEEKKRGREEEKKKKKRKKSHLFVEKKTNKQ